MKKVGVLVLLVSISLTYFLISTKPVFATPGVWSSSGNTIYYNEGKVGIGTNNPLTELYVSSNYLATAMSINNSNGGSEWRLASVGNNSSVAYAGDFAIYRQGGGVNFVLKYNGNVGIGTVNPTKKLSVNGTILAREVIVSNAASYWPDYVFKADYSLMSLEELQSYINVNNHLPNIPNENEIEKSGVSLGEMQRQQMEKIEELTLYVLQLNQRIETLEKENLQLKMNLN